MGSREVVTRTRHRASCVASGAQRGGQGCGQRGAGMRVRPASVQGLRGQPGPSSFPPAPPPPELTPAGLWGRAGGRLRLGPDAGHLATEPNGGSGGGILGRGQHGRWGHHGRPGPGEWPSRVLDPRHPPRRGLGPQGRCRAAGQGVLRAAVPEGPSEELLQLLGNSSLREHLLPGQVDSNRSVGSDGRESVVWDVLL